MNILKFKSVAVRITTYQKLKKLALKQNRSVGMMITHLTEKHMIIPCLKNSREIETSWNPL